MQLGGQDLVMVWVGMVFGSVATLATLHLLGKIGKAMSVNSVGRMSQRKLKSLIQESVREEFERLDVEAEEARLSEAMAMEQHR